MWVEVWRGREIREASLRERKRIKDALASLGVSSEGNYLSNKGEFLGKSLEFPRIRREGEHPGPEKDGDPRSGEKNPSLWDCMSSCPVSLHRLESSDVTSSHNKKNAFPAVARSPQVGRPYRFT